MGLNPNYEGNEWIPITQPTRRMVRPTNYPHQPPVPRPLSFPRQEMAVMLPSAQLESFPKKPTTSRLQIGVIAA